MPRKAKEAQSFDQQKYMQEWSKQNMMFVSARYKKDFVLEFKEACQGLGITQSEVVRNAMIDTIEKFKKSK